MQNPCTPTFTRDTDWTFQCGYNNKAATLVIHWNDFVYGDTYFRQMIDTVMGTPSAVLWAITYYYWHKKNILIPRYSGRGQMPLLVRYIDNIFAIILVRGDSGFTSKELNEFKADIM